MPGACQVSVTVVPLTNWVNPAGAAGVSAPTWTACGLHRAAVPQTAAPKMPAVPAVKQLQDNDPLTGAPPACGSSPREPIAAGDALVGDAGVPRPQLPSISVNTMIASRSVDEPSCMPPLERVT